MALYIYYMENNELVMFFMDYVAGRDCRTKVYKSKIDGNWYFDTYAFRQRNVTGEEFAEGFAGENPIAFLEQVKQELARKK